jgi:hypothetical protein
MESNLKLSCGIVSDMAKRTEQNEHRRGKLTTLQEQAVELWATGASDQTVAEKLGAPLEWVRGLSGHLLVQEAVAMAQWQMHHRQRSRLGSLAHRALDVLVQELETNPSPQLALALLKVAGKAMAPEAPVVKAEDLLKERCAAKAQQELGSSCDPMDFISKEESERSAAIYRRLAPSQLATPPDPSEES